MHKLNHILLNSIFRTSLIAISVYHSDGWSINEPKMIRVLTANSCTPCHANITPPEMQFLHFPAAEGMCTFCHEVSEKHEAGQDKKGVTTKTAEDTCFQCHTKNDDKAHVHPALMMGDPSCVNCHNPHGSNHQSYIRQNSIQELCTTCHEPHIGKSIHGAEKIDKDCVNCHNPHSATEEKLLNQPVDDLCLSCHNKDISTQFATKARVIPNIAKKMKDMPHQHTGALMGCSGCHSPHASANERLLNLSYSLSNYNFYNNDPTQGDPYGLCFMCHDRGMLENKNFTTAFRNDRKVGEKLVQKNLHWFHVTDASGYADKSRGRSCRVCHDPHGSPQDLQINEFWQMKNQVMIPIVFKKTDNGGSCTKTCHETRSYQRTQ